MTAAFATCARCDIALHPVVVATPDGQRSIELDACARCRGIWFDAGELEQVLGHPLQLRRDDVPPLRRVQCARCQGPLAIWHAASGIAIESCDGCRGCFLDEGELTRIGASEAERLAMRALFVGTPSALASSATGGDSDVAGPAVLAVDGALSILGLLGLFF